MIHESKVAYCGLYCGDCIIRQGRLAASAQKLLSQMKQPEFGKLADGLLKIMPDSFKSLAEYKVCIPVLENMVHLDCANLCKEGGGSAGCQIRICCEHRRYSGCWECRDFKECQTLSWLNPVHRGANIENIKRICDAGMETFLKGPKCW